MSKIEEQVIEKILARKELGFKKYGKTLERTDLSIKEWLVHAQEESLDLANYLQVLINRQDIQWPNNAKFKLGDYVYKKSGSCWTGHIVGFYSTELTPIGYCIESDSHKNSVQNYPEAAIDLAGHNVTDFHNRCSTQNNDKKTKSNVDDWSSTHIVYESDC